MEKEIFLEKWQEELRSIVRGACPQVGVAYTYGELDEFVVQIIEATKQKFNNLCPNCYDILNEENKEI